MVNPGGGSGQWNVVKGKRSKPNTKIDPKKWLETAPKAEDVLSPAQAAAVYSIMEASNTGANLVNGLPNGVIEKNDTNKSNEGEKKREKTATRKSSDVKHSATTNKEKEAKKVKTLENLIEQLNAKEIANLINTTKSKFPSSQIVWLKEVSMLLNYKLNVDLKDPIFSGQQADYPMCLLKNDILKLLRNLIHSCSEASLKLFFENCLSSLIEDVEKDLPAYGSRIFLQLISRNNPNFVASNLKQLIDLFASNQANKNTGLSILWVASQAGYSSRAAGFKVWMTVMLPLLKTKHYCAFSIKYLGDLLALTTPESGSSQVDVSHVISVRDFFCLFDLIFSNEKILAPNLQSRLTSYYPQLKACTFGLKPEKAVVNYFPSFLRRLEPKCSTILTDELTLSLIECLNHETNCLNIWKQVYAKQLPQSAILLHQLALNWNLITPELRKQLRLLMPDLADINASLQKSGSGSKQGGRQGKAGSSGGGGLRQKLVNPEGLTECVLACQELELLLERSSKEKRSSWPSIWWVIVIINIILIIYDIRKHDGFRTSRTGMLLKKWGLLEYLTDGWNLTSAYSMQAYRWCQLNIPSSVSETFNSGLVYIAPFWSNVQMWSIEAYKVSLTYLTSVSNNVSDWVNTNYPNLKSDILNAVDVAIAALAKYSKQAVSQAVVLYDHFHKWLFTSVLVDSWAPSEISKTALLYWQIASAKATDAYSWVVTEIQNVIK